MILPFFLFFVTSIKALQHAYLEALIHKAFDPIFGNVFLQEFLIKNAFNSEKVHDVDFKRWSQRAAQRASSAWLTKLNVKNFEPLLERINLTLSSWKDLIEEKESIVHSDVIEECASKCKLVCEKVPEKKRPQQAILNQEFLYLVYLAQVATQTAQLKQARYFELLNNANEQMERTYIVIKKYQVDVAFYNDEKMRNLARMLLESSEAIDMPPATFSPTKSILNAREALSIVGAARYNVRRPLDDYSVDMDYSKSIEEAMISVCSDLHTFSTTTLKGWAKGKSGKIIQSILSLEVFPPAAKFIEKSGQLFSADSFFPLPLSALRIIEAVANDMTSDEIMCIVKASEEYRQLARRSDAFFRRASTMAAGEKNLLSKEYHSTLDKLRSRDLPIELMNLFIIHLDVMTSAMEYLPNLVHFSNMHMSEKALVGVERDYLNNFAYWINEVTNVIPEEQRDKCFPQMFLLITLEVNCLIPEDRRKLVMMTLMLMLKGGLRAYYRK